MKKLDIKKLKNEAVEELKGLKFKNILLLFIAGIINSIGVTMFLAPVTFMTVVFRVHQCFCGR